MNRLQAAILGLFLAIGPSQVAAVPIDTSDFDSQTRLVETTGSVFFDGFADIFIASDVGSTVSVDSFLVSDPTNASLDFVDLPSILSPATAVSIMEEMVEFLFEDGNTGYLLVVDVTGQGIDFTDALRSAPAHTHRLGRALAALSPAPRASHAPARADDKGVRLRLRGLVPALDGGLASQGFKTDARAGRTQGLRHRPSTMEASEGPTAVPRGSARQA